MSRSPERVGALAAPGSIAALLSKVALLATVVLDFVGASINSPAEDYIFAAVFFTVIIGMGAGIIAQFRGGRASHGLLLTGLNLALGLISVFVFVAVGLGNSQ